MLIFLSLISCGSKEDSFEFGGPKGGSSKNNTSQDNSQEDQSQNNNSENPDSENLEQDSTEENPEQENAEQENSVSEPSSDDLDCYDLNGNPMPCEGQAEGAPTGEYADDCYDPNGNLIPCAGNEVSSEPSVCIDPVTNEEIPCEIGTGTSGDLSSMNIAITEIMFDPTGNNSLAQWFEIYVTCSEPINLEGLELSNGVISTTLPEFWLEESGFVILGRNSDMESNGGVDIDIEYSDILFSMGIDHGVVALFDGEMLIDSVPLNSFSFFYDWQEGASMQLHQGLVDPQINDQEDMWCDSSQSWDGGDLGTPHQANRPCPI